MSAAAVGLHTAAVADPVRVPMPAVLLGSTGLVTAEGVAGVLTGVPLDLLLTGVCATLVAVSALVFVLGAVTLAGFVAGAAAAGVVVLGPGRLVVVLLVMALVALCCGIAPGWARVEAWQAARSTAAVTTASVPAGPPRGGPARYWRTDRVVAAFLVLAFPPVFVTGALAFVSWSAAHGV